MKLATPFMIGAGLCLASVTPASAAVIIGLYNTGVQSGGDGWAAGSGPSAGNGAELNWNLQGSPQAFTGGTINSSWVDNDAQSQWITPNLNGDLSLDPVVNGNYVYTLDFTLDNTVDAATASFDGRFSADNQVTSITLNGVTILGSGGTYTGWTDFASLPNAFKTGENTLAFNVVNFAQTSGNPTGVRVEFGNSNVDLVGIVPEPATWAMMLVGFSAIGFSIRRKRSGRLAQMA